MADILDSHTLAEIEREYEMARRARNLATERFEVAKARFHRELEARKDAGEEMTIPRMKAEEIIAIDDVPHVREAYLAAQAAEDAYTMAKLKLNQATREYFEDRDIAKRHVV